MIAETNTSRTGKEELKRSYHFLTRDIILNEIVRRADPAGRTVGEFIRDEIAIPLAITDQVSQIFLDLFLINSVDSWP